MLSVCVQFAAPCHQKHTEVLVSWYILCKFVPMITALAKMSTVIRRQSLLYEFSIVGLMLQDKSPVHQNSCAYA